MSYKTVLVHVSPSVHLDERIRHAASISVAEDAHLIGIATSGAARYVSHSLADFSTAFQRHIEHLREPASDALDRFDEMARRYGVHSCERRLVDEEAGIGVCLQSKYCDLVVIEQVDPKEVSPLLYPDFPQYVVLNSGKPVLILPYAQTFASAGSRILIAWDASTAATRSVANAIPMLKHAQTVELAMVNPEENLPAETYGSAPGADIALYLSRHGVRVNVTQHKTDESVGIALLAMAEEMGCDLIVMGCYGRSRFREILLGGVTRTVLENMSMPLLMSH